MIQEEELFEACKTGRIETVKQLIEEGVGPSAQDSFAVIWAASNGHLEVVKYLCSLPGVDPSALDNDAVKWAQMFGHIEVVKYLMIKIVKMNKRMIKWKKRSRFTRMYDERDMRIEVLVVREIMGMKWKMPPQMMDRLLDHLLKMKVYN